jgi:signal transduction histidine kinase
MAQKIQRRSSVVSPDFGSHPIEQANGSVLRIEVVDTGPGLSLESQRKLFHETIQFNAAEMQAGNGSGFGLYSESFPISHNFLSLIFFSAQFRVRSLATMMAALESPQS